jgi:hypothetical protein
LPDVRLTNSEQIAALHDRRTVQTGIASIGSGGVNEELGSLSGVLEVAGDHGDNGVRKSSIVAIVLHHQGWSVLSTSSFDVGNLDDYNIAPLHW